MSRAEGRTGGGTAATGDGAVIETVHSVGALRFRCLEAGPRRGELVLLLHGFPQAPDCWRPVMTRLAAVGYRCVAPAQRGYSPGARPRGVAMYRPDLLVDDALGVAAAAGHRRFHIVGHDHGGMVAWVAATTAPERLRSLTAVSTPHPAAMAGALLRSLQGLRSAYMPLLRLPALPEALLGGGGNAMLRRVLVLGGLPASIAAAYAEALREPGALTAALNWYRALPLSLRTLPVVESVPTLYVWGEGDPALGRVAAEATAGHVRAPYRFEVVPDAGHWLPERHGAGLATLIAEHIGGSSPHREL